MERRQHDMFMDMVSNPTATFDNLVAAGLTANNTSLLDKSIYEKDEWVREQFKNQYGEFDQQALDAFYNNVEAYYNSLASANYEQSMAKQASYHRDNIFAPVDQRRSGPDYIEVRMANPYQTTSSIIELGKTGPRTKSIDELAQANKVLLNPRTAGDNLENAEWGDSPNDSFSDYFSDVLVQAQYDTDGTHIDPFSGKEVEHKAGEFKLDNNGNFYYEKLDGRDIYGRRVLNKMNVLTTDGSFWNKYDFFDSDDLEQKSIGGSVMKNLALVGSMFIPYVGPWITGLSIATQLAGLGATLGKMASGSDNPTLSHIEGWAKSVSRQGASSEYAQNNTWCWENFINLIGDVAGQLKEQRFIFEKIPYAFKGANAMTKEGQMAKLALFESERLKLANTQIAELRKAGTAGADLLKAEANLKTVAALKAQADLDSFIKGYNTIGSVLSKGYMTAITVGDTYGEAKLAGASDMDATLLTLGYAAGEYALLSTGLGEWVLPELRAGRYKALAIARALTQQNAETLNLWRQFGQGLRNMPKEGKKDYVKRMFNLGRDIARAEYSNGTKTLGATAASAAGEGFEEISEEFLADFSKGCYDVVKWLQGDDTRINSFGYNFDKGEWNGSEIIDRYGMSLIGGAVGGGLTNAVTNYKMVNSFNNMTSEKAIQELVYMARNGETGNFLKLINKMQLGDTNLSTDYTIDGTDIVFRPGSKENNQDVYIKRALTNQVRMIEQILQANGAVSDSKFLDTQTLGDLRFNALHKSTTAGLYLQEYNSLNSDIVRLTNLINEVVNSAADTNGDNIVTDREQRKANLTPEKQEVVKNLEEELKTKKKALDDLLSGKRAPEFISTALFEMTTALSRQFAPVTFPLFAEEKFGKKYKDLTDTEKEVARQAYEQWKTTEGRERIKLLADVYRKMAEQSSLVIKLHELNYIQTSNELLRLNTIISQFYGRLADLAEIAQLAGFEVDAELWLKLAEDLSQMQPTQLAQDLVKILGTEQDINELDAILAQQNNIDESLPVEEKEQLLKQIADMYDDKFTEILYTNIQDYVQPFIERGFANVETRNQLDLTLRAIRNIVMLRLVQWDMDAEANYDPFNPVEEVNPYSVPLVTIGNLITQVENLPNTPLEQNLDEFSIAIGSEPINLTQLTERLNASFNDSSDDVTKFTLDEELYKDLNNAIYTMLMYQAAILGARTDAANLNNLFGYNATLNEVSGLVEGAEQTQLAEINSQTADLFVTDINATLKKLQFLKQLYEINQGQKLSRQDRVATKKDLLIYKRLKSIVSVLDDDELNGWEGFLDLQNAINGMVIHDQLLQSGETKVSDDQRDAFETEKIQAENAIYDFFQIESNRQRLMDPTLLAQFINPSRLQLYTEANELLNEGLDNLDDNSLVWWLASRAAVRSTDFYNQYRQIIDPEAEKPMAPISTQELAIYNNYASIVNGDVFTALYNAYRTAIVDDWKNKSVDERKEALLRMGKSQEEINLLSEDQLANYSINFLSAPRYSNIVLTEGIPGSGKSTGVFQSTLKLLRQFNPELLLNVAVIHGANPDSAKKLRDDVGLTEASSKTYGRTEWMKEINPSWVEYARDENTGSFMVPANHYTITDENEIRSALGIRETTTPPSLVIIDEISKFSAYDLDQIDKFARKYGITVLAAGDFDQSGVSGSHKILINGQNLDWVVSLSRTNFIRAPKLGVSMRTDNSLKTANLQKLQAYMQNPDGNVTFNYFQDETGLFGDKVYQYQPGEDIASTNLAQSVLEDVDKLIETLKEGEKIGYIYSSKTSPIYQALSSDRYKSYIDFREGGSAQGLEGQYYIIEADENANRGDYLRDIYTGMSRAQLGSIIIAPIENEGVKFDSAQTSQKIQETLSDSTISSFANKRKGLLERVAAQGNPVLVVPRTLGRDAVPPRPAERRGLPDPIASDPPATTDPPTSDPDPVPIMPDEPPVEPPIDPHDTPTPPPAGDNAYQTEKTNLILAITTAPSIDEINRLVTDSNARQNGISSDADVLQAVRLRLRELTPPPSNFRIATTLPLQTIPFDTIRFNITTNISEQLSGQSLIIDYAGRKMVVVDINGLKMPFYLSTGHGGKVDVTAGKWYPFFGIGADGWLNKTSGPEINTYYGSDTLKQIAETLDREIGDIRGEQSIPKAKATGAHVDFINTDMTPTENELSTTATNLRQNIDNVLARLKPIDPPIDDNPLAEPLIYEDDIAPIASHDVVDEAVYMDLIDEASETPNIAQSTAEVNGDSVSIDMLLHSFNTFETGVLTDQNGMPAPVGSQAWMDARIDSVNGLIKVDQALGRPIRTVQEYIQQIGRLRSILFNTQDKSKLIERLQNELGLLGIYCTFALKSSPRPSTLNRNSGREFVGNRPNAFEKGISEHTEFNGSDDTRSNEWHLKSIVAVIGNGDTGNVLELPLLAMSSPFTLLQTKDLNNQPVFGLMLLRFQSLARLGADLHSISEDLVQTFDGQPQYQELVDLFKLYNFTDGGIFYINDNQWTPAKDLETVGPQFVINKGYYQLVPGLSMNDQTNPESEWVNLDEVARNPQLTMTKKVMVSMTGYVDDVDTPVVNAGHPFVLVSFNRDLNTDKKIIDQYIKQQKDPTARKEVKLMYVLPPKATVAEYIENLHKILNKTPGVENIGNLFTSYRLLKTLLQDDSFRRLLDTKVPGLALKADEAILELDLLATSTEQKDKLYEVRSWPDQGFGQTKLAGLLDGVIVTAASVRNTLNSMIGGLNSFVLDQNAIQIIDLVLRNNGIDGVYYKVKIPKNASTIGPFYEPIQSPGYRIGNKPFRIHGKIDSYTFKGHMAGLVSSALSKLRPLKNGNHMYSIDSFTYWDWNTGTHGNSNLEAKPQDPRAAEQQRKINNVVDYLKRKLNVDYSDRYANADSIELVNAEIAHEINSDDNGVIAFTIGDEIRISSPSPYLSGLVWLYRTTSTWSEAAYPTVESSNFYTDNNGRYMFRIRTSKMPANGVYAFTAIYDPATNEMTITALYAEGQLTVVRPTVDPANITQYLETGRALLEPLFDFDPDLSNAFMASTYDEFINALDNMDYVGDMRIDDLRSVLGDLTDALQAQIVNDLIAIEESHDPEKQELMCPPDIKIKF